MSSPPAIALPAPRCGRAGFNLSMLGMKGGSGFAFARHHFCLRATDREGVKPFINRQASPDTGSLPTRKPCLPHHQHPKIEPRRMRDSNPLADLERVVSHPISHAAENLSIIATAGRIRPTVCGIGVVSTPRFRCLTHPVTDSNRRPPEPFLALYR